MNDLAAQQLSACATALDYVIRRRWATIPVPFREKGPRLKGWQHLWIDSPELVARHFPDQTNIGVILGAASGGLVDVDIDCVEALEISNRILPKTGSVFGRASKQCSHYLYHIDGPAPSMTLADPLTGDALIELRGDKQDGSAGFQTLFPGSIHPSGEPIVWANDGKPALVEYDVLKRALLVLATRVLIARYCPGATTIEEARHTLEQADPRIMKEIARWHTDAGAAQSLNGVHDPLRTTEEDLAHLCRPGRRSLGGAARIGHDPLKVIEADIARVLTALSYINSRSREVWIEVGAAIHDLNGWPEELKRATWDYWSVEQDVPPRGEGKKFEQAAQDTAWRSFERPYCGPRATLGTIIYRAQQAGWDGHTLKPLPNEFKRFLLDANAPDAMASAVQLPETEAAASDQDGPAAPSTDVESEVKSGEGKRDEAKSEAEINAEIKWLAGLAPIQYERQRRKAAKDLGDMRVTILDRLVKAERGYGEDVERQGHALKLFEPELWSHAVNGRALVLDLKVALRRYVVMAAEHALVVALWILHSYVFDVFMCTPRLCITSPEKGCGKTTLLDVIACLVNRPLPTADITGPAIFRTVEKAQPTILFDEADNMFGRQGKAADSARDVLAILNSGHRHGGQVTRCVGDDFEPCAFRTHTPAVFALIGYLPGTLADRSIDIRLRRKLAGDRVEQFRIDRTEDLLRLARQARRWCEDNRSILVESDPEVPEGLFNRVADNWRPLLTIADAAGCSFEARTAAVRAAAQATDEAQGVMLLADIRLAFDGLETDKDRYGSKQLVSHLNQLETRPWSDYRRGGGITEHWLVKRLEPFEIKPEPEALYFSHGRIRARGYLRSSFDDAFARYLPSRSVEV
jgi:putative DNA primase/helicase